MQKKLKYRIADFLLSMNCQSPYMLKISESYLDHTENEEEIDLCYEEEDRHEEWAAQMSCGEFEYNFTLNRFVQKIVEKDAFCFHASAIAVDGEAILFSADSGTGKSTHARLWKTFITEHQIENFNDDKPIIRKRDGKYYAFGTPWCGKHGIQKNMSAPVKALVFLEQDEQNEIKRIPMERALPLIFPQIIANKANQEQLLKILDMLDIFLRSVPVYKLHCNISEEAVRTVYHMVWEEEKDED